MKVTNIVVDYEHLSAEKWQAASSLSCVAPGSSLFSSSPYSLSVQARTFCCAPSPFWANILSDLAIGLSSVAAFLGLFFRRLMA